MNSEAKKVYHVKYDKEKCHGKGEKPKKFNPSRSTTYSTLQKRFSISNLVCFRCKKSYSKGHKENARLSRLKSTTVGQLATTEDVV